MVKVAAISDLHGHLPKVTGCDILLIAGDICPRYDHNINFQKSWLNTNFTTWLQEVPAKKIILVAGNHDFYFEAYPVTDYNAHNIFRPSIMPHTLMCDKVVYLEDSMTEFEGLKIYGSPYQRKFHDWAFNLDEPELDKVFDKIPKCDILITHSPAFECGDWSPYGKEHCGSKKLKEKIMEIQPKLHCCGHLHSGYSEKPYMIGKTPSYNVSLVNEKYEPVNKILEVGL